MAVYTFDVPEAYLHVSHPDDNIVHMKFEGKFVDIMSEVNLEYKKFITYEKV